LHYFQPGAILTSRAPPGTTTIQPSLAFFFLLLSIRHLGCCKVFFFPFVLVSGIIKASLMFYVPPKAAPDPTPSLVSPPPLHHHSGEVMLTYKLPWLGTAEVLSFFRCRGRGQVTLLPEAFVEKVRAITVSLVVRRIFLLVFSVPGRFCLGVFVAMSLSSDRSLHGILEYNPNYPLFISPLIYHHHSLSLLFLNLQTTPILDRRFPARRFGGLRFY